jgi:hypothetical protein
LMKKTQPSSSITQDEEEGENRMPPKRDVFNKSEYGDLISDVDV